MRSLLALALLVQAPPATPVDYEICTTVHNGPIERPDHYGLPYGRKADLA